MCYETYGVNCAHYYIGSNLAGDVFHKVCCADLRLLTERDHLHFVEGMIRGGMSSVYARKYWKANNQYLDDDDKNEENWFIVNIDANNLYGGIMQNYSLSLSDFKWADNSVDIPKLLLTEEDSEWGYLAEVDIEFPDERHDYFKDYPTAPSKEIVQITDLSTDQVEMMGKLGITSLPKVPQLIQSLQKKSGYILHFLTLQLYIQLGVKVTHLHRVLQFRQCKWMAPFVQMNTELRKKARNIFAENFYQLIINSSFGKTMESKRNRTKISIVRNETELLQKLCQSSLKSFQIIHEDLARITFNPSSIRAQSGGISQRSVAQ